MEHVKTYLAELIRKSVQEYQARPLSNKSIWSFFAQYFHPQAKSTNAFPASDSDSYERYPSEMRVNVRMSNGIPMIGNELCSTMTFG